MTSILKAMDKPITRMTTTENAPSFFFKEIESH